MAHSSELDFQLDRASEVPLGTQLVWRLRSLIASGTIGIGEQLPGVREMAAAAGVNVNTVRSVYARLADQGLVVSEHGRGTFVTAGFPWQDALGRLAEQVAGNARDAGVDPRELAAALYSASPVSAPAAESAGRDARPAETHGRGAPFAAEARRRAALRTEIAQMERQLAALELPGDAPEEPTAEPERRGSPTPQLLTAAQLETIRDELAERLAERKADRVVARQQRPNGPKLEPDPEPERRNRAIGDAAPTFVAGAGGWTLRWRG
jgi:GntR family transcriptional regulator